MPNVKIYINVFFICSNGIYMLINVAITMNGPNGMYSSDFFIFVTNKPILKMAPIKNDTSVIIIMLDNPKYNPKAPINYI